VPAKILILGGTAEARELAARLAGAGHHVVTSLAGVTSAPRFPAGQVRTGGFGGASGLAGYLASESIDWLIDATHPFAARMSVHAHAAAGEAGVALVRLERRPWQPEADDRWLSVPDTGAAVEALPEGATAFVTIGRKEVASFARRGDIGVVARMIEAPAAPLPHNWRLVLARPPFSVEEEEALMRAEGVSVLVTKNAGGEGMAKLQAARRLSLPVVMIERPQKPQAHTVASIDEVLALLGEKVRGVGHSPSVILGPDPRTQGTRQGFSPRPLDPRVKPEDDT